VNVPQISCNNLTVLDSLFNALNGSGIRDFGIVFVFVNGRSQVNRDTLNLIYDFVERRQVQATFSIKSRQFPLQLNFVQTNGYPCGEPLDSQGSQMMMDLAVFTGGTYFLLQSANVGGVSIDCPA
jgi:hypothetical protein